MRGERRGKKLLRGGVPVCAARRVPAALSSLATVLAFVSIPGYSSYPHGLNAAMRREGAPGRPTGGGSHLRRLLADCSRTPVCAHLPSGWSRFLDAASGCYYYWNTFTQSSQWDAPMCSPSRPPYAPAVPTPVLTSSPLAPATATPSPTPLPDAVTSAGNSPHNETLLRVPLHPFVHGAVRLAGVDFHDFRADQGRQRSVASAFVLALRGAGVDSTVSNATLHMLGWCEDLRVTCERAMVNTSFGALSSSAGRTGVAAEGALSPGSREVPEGDKADVTEIFLRLDLQGLFFELVNATAAAGLSPSGPPAPDFVNSSSSALGSGRAGGGAGGHGRGRRRG